MGVRVAQLRPYPLPRSILQRVLNLADQCDALLLGEVHGTREVPRLMLTLLDGLAQRGYRTLAFELPTDLCEELVSWAKGQITIPPVWFTLPGDQDGRGSLETLSLVKAAVSTDWRIICFDEALPRSQVAESSNATSENTWVERDGRMARSLTEQWRRLPTGSKVLGICGNMHSRLQRMSGEFTLYWPSFAAQLLELNPGATVNTVHLSMVRGTYFNFGVKAFTGIEQIEEPVAREGGPVGHSLQLVLPEVTAATFWADSGA